MNAEYERRMRQLEEEVGAKEMEMEMLRHDLEALESDRARTAEEKKKMRDAYEEKMRKMQVRTRGGGPRPVEPARQNFVRGGYSPTTSSR